MSASWRPIGSMLQGWRRSSDRDPLTRRRDDTDCAKRGGAYDYPERPLECSAKLGGSSREVAPITFRTLRDHCRLGISAHRRARIGCPIPSIGALISFGA